MPKVLIPRDLVSRPDNMDKTVLSSLCRVKIALNMDNHKWFVPSKNLDISVNCLDISNIVQFCPFIFLATALQPTCFKPPVEGLEQHNFWIFV